MAIPVTAPRRPAQVHAPHHASENREGQVDEVSNRDSSPVALYAYAVELSWFERWEGLEDRWYER